MKNISCSSCSNTNCLVKKHCSPEWIQLIDQKKYQTLIKQNQHIINEGFPVLGIYFIQKGKVKVFSTGFTGKRQVVRFADDGHLLGHRALGTDDAYSIGAIALEDSLVCFFENTVLDEIFIHNPNFSHGLMMFYSQELRKLENRMKNIPRMNAREKVADALLLIFDSFGLNEQNELNVHFSRNTIANIAGSSSEQVSRLLADFEEENLIARYGRKIVILNLDGLKNMIEKPDFQVIIA